MTQVYRAGGGVSRARVEIAIVKVLVERWMMVLAVIQIWRRTNVRIGIVTRSTVTDNGAPLATCGEALGESTLWLTTSSFA
jgi:hypothetical protein